MGLIDNLLSISKNMIIIIANLKVIFFFFFLLLLMRMLYGNNLAMSHISLKVIIFNQSEEYDMRVHILDFIYAHPETKRAQSLRNTTFNWIHKLRTQSPMGMNTLDNRYG